MKAKIGIAMLGVMLMLLDCERNESPASLHRQSEKLEKDILNSVAVITQYRANYEQILQEAADGELASQACYKLARLNEIFGHYEEAVDYYQKLLVQYPDQPICAEGLFNLAQVYELHLDRKADAATTYGQLVHFYPEGKFALPALLRLGQLMSEQGNWAEATFYFQQLVAKFPDHKIGADVYFRLGDILELKMNDTTRAAAMYQKILDAFPDNTWAKFARKRLDSLRPAGPSPAVSGQ